LSLHCLQLLLPEANRPPKSRVRGGVWGEITLFLSEHTGDARPGTLIYLRVADARELAQTLGAVVHENPWGPDFEVTDPDGNRVRVGTPSWW
jgi:hypothetical protein